MRVTQALRAGHGHITLTTDPAFSKYSNMYTNRHKYFRWTSRTAGLTVLYVAIIPVITGYVAYATDGKYELRGKRRGDTISEF